MKCTISRCEASATAMVTLSRPAQPARDLGAWHGTLNQVYCGEHAVGRLLDGSGIEQYGDAWMLEPFKAGL